MNGIIGFTNLRLDTRLDTEQLDHVNTVRGSAETLLTIINDTLDYSGPRPARCSSRSRTSTCARS